MRALAVFRAALRSTRRDPLTVVLTLAFAPLFVLLYLAVFGGTTTYPVVVVDADRPVTTSGASASGAGLVAALQAAGTSSTSPISVTVVDDRAAGLARLRDRSAAVLLEVPEDFSTRLAAHGDVVLTFEGDVSAQRYLLSTVLVANVADSYVRAATGRTAPMTMHEVPLVDVSGLDDFDVSVAGLLVFAVVLGVFLASMAVARDVESGAMRRLRLTGMRPAHYLLGTSGVLVLVALAGVALTFGTALACGFHSNGPVAAAFVVCAVCAVSVIGVGMLVGALAGTVARAFVVANFPLGVMMFLSGAMLPMPQPVLGRIAGHPVTAFDVIPATSAVNALNKVLVLGEGLDAVGYELTVLVVLSAACFAAGALALHRRHLRLG